MSLARRFLIGIAGASGAVYALRLLETLIEALDCPSDSRGSGAESEILVVATHPAELVLRQECGVDPDADPREWIFRQRPQRFAVRLVRLDVDDREAGPASGCYPLEAMAIVPCSMHTLGAVAAGLADNLLTRAASVCLKESRRLVLVPRETPLSAIHLENMLRLARAGARLVPACPGFYHRPQTAEDLVAYMVQKIAEQLGVDPVRAVSWPPDETVGDNRPSSCFSSD